MAKRNIGREIVKGLEEIKAWKKGKKKLKTDTAIRHVTKPGANLFRELGFSPAEAKRLHAESTVGNALSEKVRDRWKDSRKPILNSATGHGESRAPFSFVADDGRRRAGILSHFALRVQV